MLLLSAQQYAYQLFWVTFWFDFCLRAEWILDTNSYINMSNRYQTTMYGSIIDQT